MSPGCGRITSMRQLQLFTQAEIAGMRDRTASRAYSPEGQRFRLAHERHRAWGLTRRHNERLRRTKANPSSMLQPGAARLGDAAGDRRLPSATKVVACLPARAKASGACLLEQPPRDPAPASTPQRDLRDPRGVSTDPPRRPSPRSTLARRPVAASRSASALRPAAASRSAPALRPAAASRSTPALRPTAAPRSAPTVGSVSAGRSVTTGRSVLAPPSARAGGSISARQLAPAPHLTPAPRSVPVSWSVPAPRRRLGALGPAGEPRLRHGSAGLAESSRLRFLVPGPSASLNAFPALPTGPLPGVALHGRSCAVTCKRGMVPSMLLTVRRATSGSCVMLVRHVSVHWGRGARSGPRNVIWLPRVDGELGCGVAQQGCGPPPAAGWGRALRPTGPLGRSRSCGVGTAAGPRGKGLRLAGLSRAEHGTGGRAMDGGP
ncbi:hypothetical protein CLV70_13536 [Pseudosporangium ferrugineum]|uniref:Uncharacterized protein n=1 Tax=Pseudosporangium ferrugineum TaxID=439699 RepID=A0A2T0RDU3_9ACTN|nr:hypothetical protein CLV70_13536 [Pseudosporangium ferrugineum]